METQAKVVVLEGKSGSERTGEMRLRAQKGRAQTGGELVTRNGSTITRARARYRVGGAITKCVSCVMKKC